MNIIERVKNILLSPKTEWAKINSEPPANLGSLITGYTVMIAGVGALGIFIGAFLIGYHGFTVPFKMALIGTLIWFIAAVGTVIIGVFVADGLAGSMGAEKSMGKSTAWIVYGLTPACLSLFLGIISGANMEWFIYIVGFGYSFYLLYVGAPIVKKTAEDKTIPYVAVTTGACLLVMILLVKILEKIAVKLY